MPSESRTGGKPDVRFDEGDQRTESRCWTNTSESLADYRRRLRAKAPTSMKLVGFVVVPARRVFDRRSDRKFVIGDWLFGFVGLGLLGGGVTAAFSMPLLSKLIWKIDYRRKK